ncbi:hypothetical protein [Anatilimnocola floriformis]|uniref:hypothetical protein n=1 Tax=Anatilimnocola floriformis TaxID=2948575 RepID=UPI0020C2617E|nr:hypothetical protein [Anatilimnocola floriformis]
MFHSRLLSFVSLAIVIVGSAATTAQDFEQEPIAYSKRQPDNRVSRLIEQIKQGRQKLNYDEKQGYLPALLDVLKVPRSSQMLVFSKTSLQRQRIAPRTPRAIYFSDDVYVGYCHDGDVLEISTADDQLGAVFYTLAQDDQPPPRFVRQTDSCLICHGMSTSLRVPSHVVRSVYSDPQGLPILASGSYRTDHTSPFEQRWGGWYVTGTHGEQKHLGNLIVRGRDRPEAADNSAGQNVTDLSKWLATENYLTPHSDIVALMVLEHQALVHNQLTHARFATEQALYFDKALSEQLKENSADLRDSTKSRIKSACEPLVECLLFSEETPLTEKISGTSEFAADFIKAGPRDDRGRSLRELDLTRRMFKYPCSYLIYSSSFLTLPQPAKEYVVKRMKEVLTMAAPGKKFQHLSESDRANVLAILEATHPDFKRQ